jgi:hypothetical protein
MPVNCSHAALAGLLLCLFLQGGCGQQPDASGDARSGREIPALPEPPVAAPPEMPAPVQPPAARDEPVEPAGAADNAPTLESLVLTPPDTPFAEQPVHDFGEVPDTGWLAAPAQRPTTGRVLPDLFGESESRKKVNVEGELMLDGSHGTSRMMDGVGMKIEVNTD